MTLSSLLVGVLGEGYPSTSGSNTLSVATVFAMTPPEPLTPTRQSLAKCQGCPQLKQLVSLALHDAVPWYPLHLSHCCSCCTGHLFLARQRLDRCPGFPHRVEQELVEELVPTNSHGFRLTHGLRLREALVALFPSITHANHGTFWSLVIDAHKLGYLR
ncbi:hypothetical protein PIB30_050586 [Stylosanthes scabra]|uniref:Uncharacterized protein n=1 Tax=Stylosanthes scabra TaxID=79078 RepID=A0ABU6UJ57_9FABA|nr:hypothetical protein [Stylosanthes scabra]